ncbi:MAG: N-acetylglucosamine-6-phosphate deacetylase, partial [Acidobacteriota bacterium]|nr:N-acetylglucosamine-6-phosphate deacetylase [Acidobacteriota bacterium]
SQDSSDPQTLLLKNARVVLPDAATGPTNLLVADGRIARVNATDEQLTPARALDLDGLTLYPGFIDVHIHGAVGVDTMQASADDLRRVARFLATRGVTAWLPTLVPAPPEDYRRAVASIETLMRDGRREEEDALAGRSRAGADAVGARALGVHYEGPFVNTAQCGALRTEYFRAFKGPSSLDELATLPADLAALAGSRAAHMTTLAPEIDGGVALVGELVSRGWIVSIGHTRADAATLDAARDAGARHMTHFFNAMSPLHHRDPGVVGWGLLDDRVTCDVIADGVHSDPLMLRLALRCKTPARLALISDAVLPAGLGDGDYEVWGETISVTGGRTRNARGSIAGSVITMLDAARTMLSLGCAPHDVARMASLNPARLLGLDALTGSIEEGKRADLVAVDAQGRARLTLVGGRVAHDSLTS